MTSRVLVTDASAVVAVLRRTELGDRVAAAMRGATVAAPAHLDAEVLSALGRLSRAGDIEPAAIELSLDRLARMPTRRYPLPPLLRRAWALRANIALRDALYVACAESLDAVLVTLDGRLARSVAIGVEHVT